MNSCQFKSTRNSAGKQREEAGVSGQDCINASWSRHMQVLSLLGNTDQV